MTGSERARVRRRVLVHAAAAAGLFGSTGASLAVQAATVEPVRLEPVRVEVVGPERPPLRVVLGRLAAAREARLRGLARTRPRPVRHVPVLFAPPSSSSPLPSPAAAPPVLTAGGPSAGFWERVAACESGDDWSIDTGNGFYGGLQFTESSWLGAGGGEFASRPDLASAGEQMLVADRLLRMQGPGAWPVCWWKAAA